MKKFSLGEGLLSGGAIAIITSILQSLGKAAQDEGVNYLKGKMFGMGTNDEQLFLAACAYAVESGLIGDDDLIRVLNVIKEYSSREQSRIVQIIGKGEEQVFHSQDFKMTEKEKEKVVAQKENIKGARIVAMLGRFKNADMKVVLNTVVNSDDFFKNSFGAAYSKVKPSVEVANEKLKTSLREFKEDTDNFFLKETWLERKVREMEENERRKK